MFTKDPGGCLGVNVRFPNEDLNEQVCTRSVTNVPIRVPGLDFTESRECQGRHDALDNLDVLLSSSGLKIDKGGTKDSEMFKRELAMIGGDVKQVVMRISHILGNFQVPSRSGGSEAKQCQKGLEPSRLNIEEVCRILTERPDSSTVDDQALSG